MILAKPSDEQLSVKRANTVSPVISVVIVNYRTPTLTKEAIRSIERARKHIPLNCVVVDNSSGDGSVEAIKLEVEKNDWDWCTIIASKNNAGFSAGNNIGIRSCDSDYVLLLNSDAQVREHAIEILYQELQHHPNVAIVSPRLEWPDASTQISCFRFFRPICELTRAASFGWLTRQLPDSEVAISTERIHSPQGERFEWTSFACVLIRRSAYELIGGMDEAYFMYYDDVDFCKEASKRNLELRHVPAARVVHLRGGTSPVKRLQSERKRRPGYFYESRSRYYAKHFGLIGLLKANLYWMSGFMIGRFKSIVTRRPPSHCSFEWIDIWKGFGKNAGVTKL
ncbi:MAG: glycosyltransferase family 2 protein [Planctomycetota bacterium]